MTLLFRLFHDGAFADIRADARKCYRTGMALLKSGKVDDGVEALEKAFSLMPSPKHLTHARPGIRATQGLGAVDPLL